MSKAEAMYRLQVESMTAAFNSTPEVAKCYFGCESGRGDKFYKNLHIKVTSLDNYTCRAKLAPWLLKSYLHPEFAAMMQFRQFVIVPYIDRFSFIFCVLDKTSYATQIIAG